ncbi:CPBP family intramembrane metalloprotease [Haloarcula sp. S1AR25-5A]|uniref:CPBP family intramembrane metalloprotease n=1 Tax=Haloarcula terrestris TaxID=2950533 RepID=A0AAE4EUL8_9EURY|nr:type II CAAX endopeptidase family protein [Haloarcula terrestris]MDS0220410.1 CPBP family intramembrane metalloprotease [Haloarcula terrestris]
MVRSDFITEVRGYIINPTEHRLRAPWRVTVWLFASGFVAIVLALLFSLIPAPRDEGSVATALYILLEQGWTFAVLLIAGLGVGYLLDRRTLADYGLKRDRQWWRDTAFGLVLGAALPTLILGLQLAAGLAAVTGVLATTDGGLFPTGSIGAVGRLLLLVPFFVVQATSEEVLFRSYLLTNAAEGVAGILGRTRAVAVAVLVTGVLFGVVHGSNPGATGLAVLNVMLYGFFLGACYAVTGRLGVAAGFHVAWNYALAVLGFPVSGLTTGVSLLNLAVTGDPLVTGGSFGPEGGLLALLSLVLAVIALYWWVRREYGAVELLDDIATPELRIRTRADTANQDG